MSKIAADKEQELIERALKAARDTRYLAVEPGIRHRTSSIFSTLFGSREAVIVADGNTYKAAGRDVEASFARENRPLRKSFIFGPHIYANIECVQELVAALRDHDAIPVAVGSGTINDLTKLAAHQTNRQYMVVGTAASMDGYSAYGASITVAGSKDTIECPAPLAVLADLDVISLAPREMNAWGYGDLMAKVVAGADWVLADAAGVEPIDPPVWESVQGLLRSWIGAPDAIAANDPAALKHLVHGLVMSGFAMQTCLNSRPASGAEHQFSHLWDMQHHTFQGKTPSHGFKVGIGVLASLALHEDLLKRDLHSLDVEAAVRSWPSMDELEQRIHKLFGAGALETRGIEETRAKYVSGDALRVQLTRLKENWTELRSKLDEQLFPFSELRDMLCRAGCPFEPMQIGISPARLRLSYQQCCYMRRRFTVLDVMQRLGLFDSALDNIFSPQGSWPIEGEELT
ncbi:MAG TPA: sn-glycerol-1-phosphate dehydrogenase [Terracidiphilus sp.]|nr:sn-glycerol-1-phosphate dehydrogenase [Terracidiphilus sp.]